MSITDKLQAARSIVEQHNSQLENGQEQVSFEAFEKKLKALGGTTEDALRECTWEDLQDCGLPRILARKVANIFRTEAPKQTPPQDLQYVSEARAKRMHPLALLQSYAPDDNSSPVFVALSDLVNRTCKKGKRFIVLDGTGKVNAPKSYELLRELQAGMSERRSVDVDGTVCPVYELGHQKTTVVDENPIYRGHPLRFDGTCDQTNRSWKNVPDVVRQLVYLAIHTSGEIAINSITDAHNVMDMAIRPDAEKFLRGRYHAAAIKFDELKERGDLPKMKIPLGDSNDDRPNDPFYSKHRRF